MALTVGPSFTVAGYLTTAPPDFDTECEATLYAADSLVGHAAFWRAYLTGPLGADRAADHALPVGAAERNEMDAVLDDPERWPAVPVRLAGDDRMWIVYRNFESDAGLDFVRVSPDRPVQVHDLAQDCGSSSMTWADLLALAEVPDERLSWAQRFVLLLPLLEPQELPDDAGAVIDRALDGIGAANRAAVVAELLDALDWQTH
ncbi:hypothetical protein [Catellatospora methionotrophica]|nr:hypothetical protein [Catellatospora methionotrophica]